MLFFLPLIPSSLTVDSPPYTGRLPLSPLASFGFPSRVLFVREIPPERRLPPFFFPVNGNFCRLSRPRFSHRRTIQDTPHSPLSSLVPPYPSNGSLPNPTVLTQSPSLCFLRGFKFLAPPSFQKGGCVNLSPPLTRFIIEIPLWLFPWLDRCDR